jgi:hypothetical protein
MYMESPKIKVSIVIPILNSHEIVRRQILHFKKMDLPDDIEIIFMDDGSSPPLSFPNSGLRNFSIHTTGDKRAWMECLARNKGAKIAVGEILLMTDIDHILPKDTIEAVHEFKGDKMEFPRFLAILNSDGDLTQDLETLFDFGLSRQYYNRKLLNAGRHGNTFAMRKEVFDGLGGYSIRICERPWHEGADRYFNREWRKAVATGRYKPSESGPQIYTFPVGRFCGDGSDIDFNPHGLFNTLKRKEVPQPDKL